VESTYKIIELIGTSPKSWEEAAKRKSLLSIKHNQEQVYHPVFLFFPF
jgi:flavin-binding protein dodecin